MRECLTPYIPQLTLGDRRAGKVVYPVEDERIGGTNMPLGHPCNRCPNCRANRRWRWVGRCLAEQCTSVEANFVTLTYGRDRRYGADRDHPHARTLVYDDVQKWLKRLRFAGHRFSYLATGEYGDLKGRAHWHVALFWQTDKVPAHSWGRNWQDEFWSDGVVDWKPLNEANIAYICQYILPDAGDGALHEQTFRKSTKPPLGYYYFENRARDFVEAGLAPQDGVYTFPGVVIDKGKLKGKPKHFFLSDCARDRFLRSYVRQWTALRPGRFLPESDYVAEYLDRAARSGLEQSLLREPLAMGNLIARRSYYMAAGGGLVVPGRFRAA